MSPSAITAVEKAADTLNGMVAKKPSLRKSATASGVAPEDVYKPELLSYAVGSVGEGQGTALVATNVDGPSCVPALGDRVANLSYRQAQLGLKGTVVAVHAATGFVEVVFDGEFIGGGSLGGLCSNGRGALVPWSALLCLSRLPSEAPPAGLAPVLPGTAAAANAFGSSQQHRGGGGGVAALTGTDEDAIARLEGMPRGKQRGPQQTQYNQQQQQRSPQPSHGQRQQQPQQQQQQQQQQQRPVTGPGAPYGQPSSAGAQQQQLQQQRKAATPAAAAPPAAGTSIPLASLFGGKSPAAPAPAAAASRTTATVQGIVSADELEGAPALAPALVPARPAAPVVTPAPASGGLDLPAIARQVEFYFSDVNLAKDAFMAHLINADVSSAPGGQGWVPLATIKGFKRMQELARGDADVIAAAVATHSKLLLVSSDRKKIRRVHPWAAGAQPAAPAASIAAPAQLPPVPPPAVAPAPATAGRPDPLAYYASMMGGQQQQQQQQQQAKAPVAAAPSDVRNTNGGAAAPAADATGAAADGRAHFESMMARLQRSAAPQQQQQPVPQQQQAPPYPQQAFGYGAGPQMMPTQMMMAPQQAGYFPQQPQGPFPMAGGPFPLQQPGPFFFGGQQQQQQPMFPMMPMGLPAQQQMQPQWQQQQQAPMPHHPQPRPQGHGPQGQLPPVPVPSPQPAPLRK